MTVLDTSVVVDMLLGSGVARAGTELLEHGGPAAAPDVLPFEVLAVLRRLALREGANVPRLAGAVSDLGDVSVDLFPALPLRTRAWALRDNFTVADALFVALAEQLDAPLATADRRLAAAASDHTDVPVILLDGY